MRISKLKIVFFTFLLVLICIEIAFAKDKVYWPGFDYPPLFMYSESGGRSGVGNTLNEYIQNMLPGNTHINIIESPVKILLDTKSGKNRIITGIVKTAEREKYLYYSKYPCMVSWSMVAVIRKEDRNKFITNGKFSLYTNLNNTNNIFSYMKGIYYGKLLDIIKETNSKNHGVAAFDTIDQINLLLHNRIDFFFADPLVAYYTQQGDINKSNIEFVECLELPITPIYRYYATPKTKWGNVMIRKIDVILKDMICSGRLEAIVKNWTPDNFKNKLEKAYQQDITDKVLCD